MLTYLKEEIQVEQLVRNIDPFRLFLPIAAQMSGQLINYSNISKDTGVSYGNAFESWFIFECFARNQYLKKGFKFSYLRTKDDVEIDLIIQKPNGEGGVTSLFCTGKRLLRPWAWNAKSEPSSNEI